jgi:hypothetical protein
MTPTEIVVAFCAAVTALSSLGAVPFLVGAWRNSATALRILRGEDTLDSDTGLVGTVDRHDRALTRAGLLAETDGGRVVDGGEGSDDA